MSSSKFVGQLKQNNIQINNLKDSLSRTEKHMTDYEKELSNEINSFMERQNFELKSHTEDINNPHKVTKTQIGLDKVLNVEQASKTEFDLHASNIENPHNVTAAQIGLSNVLNEKQATKVEFDDHVKNLSNPHSVTKEQIGLGNVTNVEQASKTNFDNHASDKTIHVSEDDRNKWNTAEDNAKGYTDEHASRKDNPHGVTKVQIGLGNVKDVEQASLTDFNAHNSNSIRHITADERSKWNSNLSSESFNKAVWSNITLQNGATAGTRTPIYSKWGNLLLIRGHIVTSADIIFGTIPTTAVPIGGSVNQVPISGTGGSAGLIIYDTGEMKIKYPTPTDSSKVAGYYLDIAVPLQ